MPEDEQLVDDASVFPFYLDVEMLTGFLATIEDGFLLISNVSETETNSKANDLSASGTAGTSSFLSSLFKIDLQGGLKLSDSSQGGRELGFVLQHTEASLFNRLRERLTAKGLITHVGADSIEMPLLGSIVEIDGVIQQNPVATVLELIDSMSFMFPQLIAGKSFSEPQKSTKPSTQPPRGQRGSSLSEPASQEPEFNAKVFFDLLRRERESRKLSDVVVTIGSETVNSGIITLRQSATSQESAEHFIGSRCLILGKVSGVVEDGDSVPLYRRSIINLLNSDQVEGMFKGFNSNEGFHLDLPSLTVSGPAIQVLPVAIYV